MSVLFRSCLSPYNTLFQLNKNKYFAMIRKSSTSVKLFCPFFIDPTAYACNACHWSGMQQEKTTGTETAVDNSIHTFLLIFIIIGTKETLQVLKYSCCVRGTVYGILSNYLLSYEIRTALLSFSVYRPRTGEVIYS